jgi:hypothetical protein
MCGEIAFELGGRDLKAFVFNKFFYPVGYVEVSVFVLVADVTRLSDN